MDGAIERSIAMTIRLLQKLQEERGKRNGVKPNSFAQPPARP
jgi:hypothetical protein